MLPLHERAYRRLLAIAMVFGIAGGVFALAYSLITGWGIGFFFGEPTSELFSGEWWWIPLINSALPEIPTGLAVACMLAAVPGAAIAAPVSFVLIGVGTVGLGVEAIAPIGVAVITAYVTVSALRLHLVEEDA